MRRTVWESFGSDRYSRPALHELDRKLERYLGFDNGFFIEAGANDGFAQSNTYYFEMLRGWSGILIEPIPALFEQCRSLRKRSRVVNAALVSAQFPNDTIEMHYADLMSVVSDRFESPESLEKHLADAMPHMRAQAAQRIIQVPARTLTSILDELQIANPIDFLSLDLEGYELEALQGLDLSRYSPRFICVEVRDEDSITSYLRPYYEPLAVLSDHGALKDILFQRREARDKSVT